MLKDRIARRDRPGGKEVEPLTPRQVPACRLPLSSSWPRSTCLKIVKKSIHLDHLKPQSASTTNIG